MTELDRIQREIALEYAMRPRAEFGLLLIGSGDYAAYDGWVSRLESLRKQLVDLCEGRIEYICKHPAGAIIWHPVTKKRLCLFCGKDLK